MPYINTTQGAISGKLYYEDWGQGQPMVFIHGWPSSHEMWEYQLTYFASKGYRVIAYDRRGFGKSFKPWEGYDYGNLAADLKRLLEELDLRNVTLIGFSMGGGEVVRYCQEYNSDRIRKIVLLSSVIPFMLKTQDNPEGLEQKLFDGFIEKLLGDRPAFLKDFGKQFFGETFANHPLSQPLLDWAHLLTLQGSLKATIDCIGSFSATDFRKELDGIDVPALVIHGDADKIVPIELSSARTAKMLRQATYKVYPGAPHGLFITEKDRLNADIAEFMQA